MKSSCYLLYSLYRVDIESQMTMFAYYYVGIGLGVLFVSYFQVSMHAFHIQHPFESRCNCCLMKV